MSTAATGDPPQKSINMRGDEDEDEGEDCGSAPDGNRGPGHGVPGSSRGAVHERPRPDFLITTR